MQVSVVALVEVLVTQEVLEEDLEEISIMELEVA